MTSAETDDYRRNWFSEAVQRYISNVVDGQNGGIREPAAATHVGGSAPILLNIPEDISSLVACVEHRQVEDGFEAKAGRIGEAFVSTFTDIIPIAQVMGMPSNSMQMSRPVRFDAPAERVIVGVELIDNRFDGKNGSFELVEASVYHVAFKFKPETFERQDWSVRLYYVDPTDFEKQPQDRLRHEWFCKARDKYAQKRKWMDGLTHRGEAGKPKHHGFSTTAELDSALHSEFHHTPREIRFEKWSMKSIFAMANIINSDKNEEVVLRPPGPAEVIVGFEIKCEEVDGDGTYFRILEATPRQLHVWFDCAALGEARWTIKIYWVDQRLYH
ncbi:hypothetical protein JCM6882_002027 [Rhodosporidiobolus microsporus]